jgi:hypothetical protein
MTLPTEAEILNAAEQLPDDESRRQLADTLRYRAQHDPDIEFDERQEKMALANQIEALCTTPKEPHVVASLVSASLMWGQSWQRMASRQGSGIGKFDLTEVGRPSGQASDLGWPRFRSASGSPCPT